MSLNRRAFLQAALTGAVVALAPRTARAADARIEILLDEPIGPITANLYGHFVEHLGGVVYDGVWVGEGSKIPNTNGIRQRARSTHASSCRRSIRWPGGCFADSYDWRDGIGPRDAAATRAPTSGPTTWPKPPDGPRQVRSESFRHRTTSSASASWRAASRTSRPTCAACRRAISINGSNTATRPAGSTTLADTRPRGRARTVRGALLGRRQRVVGLRRKLHARGVRDRVSPIHGLGAALRRRPGLHRFRTEQRRPRLDAAVLHQADREGPGHARIACGAGRSITTRGTSAAAPRPTGTQGKGDAVGFTNDEWYELLNEADRMEA